MSRGSKVLIGFMVAFVLGLLCWLGFQLERVERTIDVGFSGEARANPLLASERLLNGLG